jgi:hypothetical protein
MICAGCGKFLRPRALFCSKCGRRVRATAVDEPLAPERGREEPVLVQPPLDAERVERRLAQPQALRDMPPRPPRVSRGLPTALVVAGAVLAAGVHWSLVRDEAAVKQAGARRIAAATGAAATTSQPAAPRPAEFSARQALQGLYGNYDPVVDGAYWIVTGAPKQWREWNGKTVAIKPLISRSDEVAARHVLVTNSVEVEDGMVVTQGTGCRNCKSLLGAAVYQRRGNEWQLISEHRFLTVDGMWGAPPHVAVAFLDSGAVELRFSRAKDTEPEGKAPGPVFVLNGGKVVRIDAARPDVAVAPTRAAAREERTLELSDSAFPSAAAGP